MLVDRSFGADLVTMFSFYNTGSGRVRWTETQGPKPPARHACRWVAEWRGYEE